MIKNIVSDNVIILTQSQIPKVMEVCNESGKPKPEFENWLMEEATFIVKDGVFQWEMENDNWMSFLFDTSDVDEILFKVQTASGKTAAWFAFERWENEGDEEIQEIVLKEIYYDFKAFSEVAYALLGEIKSDPREKEVGKISKGELEKYLHLPKRQREAGLNKLSKEADELEGKVKTLRKGGDKSLHLAIQRMCVKAFLSTMFYYSQIKPIEEIVSRGAEPQNSEIKEIVNATYKYTGYVNLNKRRVIYIADTSKAAMRKYQRHIESWGVRGHYRKTKHKGVIWIDPFVKGKGVLEQRIYGTDEQPPESVEAKIFEVEREVVVSEKTKTEFQMETKTETAPPLPEKPRPGIMHRVFKWLFNFPN